MIALGLVLLLGAQDAGFATTLTEAADSERTEDARMALFDSLVAGYPGNRESLVEVAQNKDAPPRERWVAIRVLGKTGSRSVEPVVLSLLQDPRPTVRVAALSAIGDLKPTHVTERVSRGLEDPALVVRGTAADTLGILKDAAAIPALEKALADPTNYYRGQSVWARSRFVLAMGSIGSKQAFGALSLALSDEDPQVVDSALVALRRIVGYDFAEGRSRQEHIEAWQRWLAAQ